MLSLFCCCCCCLRYVIIWYVWSWTKVSIDLYAHLTHALSEFCAYRPWVGKSLKLCPGTPHQLTAEVYPHHVSTSVSAWDYLASTHANTSTVKHSGLASLPRKSQAARNGAILLRQVAATFFRQYWVLAFCLCIHKQGKHIYMYTKPVHTTSSVYTYISIYMHIQ